MTKDRARKQAARQRAARTGERYVVAQRAVAEPAAPGAGGRWDTVTHRVPGVPPHVDGGLQGNARRNSQPGRALQDRGLARGLARGLQNRPRHNDPRILVAWQNWIARRLGVGGR